MNMITVSDLSIQFGGSVLFQHVDLQFTAGNCYGVIGANGAGKSTFLRILSGELESTKGFVAVKPGVRMSVLKQDQFQYDAYPVMDTVIMGNQRLYDVMKEKDAIYEKEDFSDEDGLRAAELEAEFAEMNGWEAESDASRILQGLGIDVVSSGEIYTALQAGRCDIPLWEQGNVSDVLNGYTILEIKFNQYLPEHIRMVLESVTGERIALSKYTLCRQNLLLKQGDYLGGRL